MKSLIDLAAIFILAGVGFISWFDTPLGKTNSLAGFEEQKKEEQTKEQKITIEYPKDNERVYGYLNVGGIAEVSSRDYYVRVKDKTTGEVFIKDKILILSPEIGTKAPWQHELNLTPFLEGKNLIIEVYNKSGKNGEIENTDSVSVVIWRKN